MSVETKYKKHELRDHIYEIPDTYVGSVNLTEIKTYVFDDDSKQMIDKTSNMYQVYIRFMMKF
jgi:hypothetical protein